MATIPTYSIGDIIRTRGSLAGLIGRVIYYEPPDDDLEDHGGLCFKAFSPSSPVAFGTRAPTAKLGQKRACASTTPKVSGTTSAVAAKNQKCLSLK